MPLNWFITGRSCQGTLNKKRIYRTTILYLLTYCKNFLLILSLNYSKQITDAKYRKIIKINLKLKFSTLQKSLNWSNRMSVCVVVPKDLAKHWTDQVHLNRVVLIGPGKVYNYFGGGYHHPPKRNHNKIEIFPPHSVASVVALRRDMNLTANRHIDYITVVKKVHY